jgi:nickel transport protein
LTAFLTFIPGMVVAHGVSVTAHWEGDEVHTDSYYADGKPVANAHAEAFDMTGNVILEGRTDDTGTWDFPIPEAGDLKIVVTTDSGHRGETVLREGSASNQTEDLNVQLASLRDSILELEKQIRKPGISEILGGIGWIIGIAGAYVWGASRRRRPGNQ